MERRDDHDTSWRLLRDLHAYIDLPWLCGGDFNEILFDEEKVGEKKV